MKYSAHRLALLTFALTGCASGLVSISRAQPAEAKSPQSTNGPSAGTSAKEKTDSVENRARAALLAGDAEKAVAILDPYLAANPKARAAWILRALASEKAGNALAASAIVDFIQRDFDPSKGPPPPDIRVLQTRFEKSRAQQMKLAPADIPKWSWPPMVVLPAPNLNPTAGQTPTSNPVSGPILSPASTRTPSATSTAATSPTSTSTPTPSVPAAVASQSPGAATPGSAAKTSDVKPTDPGVGLVVDPKTLSDDGAKSDTHGQWAASAKASSEYGSPGYAAAQVTGLPDVAQGGDDTHAWCASSSAHTPQWIEATFSKPVSATEVRIRQSYNPGAIVKIEAVDTEGAAHIWWQGVDPARPPGALNAIAWFAVRVPKTTYRVASVRVTLDVDAVASWQEIDAIQLIGTEP